MTQDSILHQLHLIAQANGLTAAAWARAAGLPKQNLNAMLMGHREPRETTLIRLAEAAGATITIKNSKQMNVNLKSSALFSAEKIRENPDYENRKMLFCANPYLWLFATTLESLTGKEITLATSYKVSKGRSDAQARDEGIDGCISEEVKHYALGGQPVPMAENGELVDSLLAFTGITEEQLREAAGKRTEYLQ